MSLYSVLVANKPLPQIDCTGITEITVRELKKLYPENNYDGMNDDSKVLHVADESAFSQLNIFQWDNYPYDLDEFNEKPYVYGIDGRWESKFLTDLLNYLRESIKKEHGAELIRFWAGEYNQKLKKMHLNIETLELQHLEDLSDKEYLRVVFD